MLDIQTISVNDLPKQPDLVAALRNLTLETESGMRAYLRDIGSRTDDTIVIANYRGKLVGWGLVKVSETECDLMVYIAPHYRRRGIGSILMSKLNSIAGSHKKNVYPWDARSNDFFKQINKQSDLNIVKK